MTIWLVEPRDPLIVREGRPFGPDPGAWATSLPFPFPSTTRRIRLISNRIRIMKAKLALLIAGFLLFAIVTGSAQDKPLRVFIRSGPKTHGPGQHDHPRFLTDWKQLLTDRGMKIVLNRVGRSYRWNTSSGKS